MIFQTTSTPCGKNHYYLRVKSVVEFTSSFFRASALALVVFLDKQALGLYSFKSLPLRFPSSAVGAAEESNETPQQGVPPQGTCSTGGEYPSCLGCVCCWNPVPVDRLCPAWCTCVRLWCSILLCRFVVPCRDAGRCILLP